MTRCNVETGKTENMSPEVDLPTPARHTWTLPLVFSPADQHALYFSDQYLFKTTDGGNHWARISEDMTRENPGVPPNLDAATAADVPPQSKRLGVIYTIAPSAVKAPLLWIGTDDGYIHVTQDDGKTWPNVTPPGVGAWSKVVMLEASHFDANEAYAAVDRHRLEDNEPYIYRTKDAGKTWQKITTGLPAGVYMQTVKEDPKRRGLLVAGTELGVFVSFNDGDTWQSLQLNLPPTSMRDLAFHDNDLIVATHGRGFWVLDDISALRQMSPDVASADAHLFKPADAIILPPGTDDGTPTQKDEPEAENPPNGAIVDYYLKTAAAGPVTLEILNASGATIRRFSSADPAPAVDPNTLAVNAIWQRPQEPPSAAAGMHRFVWDLRPEAPQGGRGRGGRRRRWWRRRARRPAAGRGRRLLGEADGERQELHAAADREAGSAEKVVQAFRLPRMSFSRAVSVTELSWFWIVLLATVPPIVGGLIALPCWLRSQPILGNIAGSAVIFGSALALILRESVEIDRITRGCLDAGYTCFRDAQRLLAIRDLRVHRAVRGVRAVHGQPQRRTEDPAPRLRSGVAMKRGVVSRVSAGAAPVNSYDGGCVGPRRFIVPLTEPSAATVPVTV